ncbi:MAG: hypothetical protein KAU28_09350, partial [Phycisphaerae bacterium]|nr:hypothetical protein [Phycisphaerae bacterium]
MHVEAGEMLPGRINLTARVVVAPIDLARSPGALINVLADQPDPAMLESSALDARFGRYSIAACRPIEVLTLRSGVLTDKAGAVIAKGDEEIWKALRDAFAAVRLIGRPAEAGYLPGWIGYVGYEVGRHTEHLPGAAMRDTHPPDLRLAFYDAVLLYDAMEQSWWLVELLFDS